VLSLPGQVALALVIAGRGKVSVDELLASRSWANLWYNLAHGIINTPTASFTGDPQIVVGGTSLTRSSLKHVMSSVKQKNEQ
jgi:hypothetical protein